MQHEWGIMYIFEYFNGGPDFFFPPKDWALQLNSVLTGMKSSRLYEIWKPKHALCMKKGAVTLQQFPVAGLLIESVVHKKKHGCLEIQIPGSLCMGQ